MIKRKGEGALEWAEGLDEKSRKLALGAILRFAAGESPALAKQWIDRLKEGYGADWAVSFASVAVKAAAARGTDDWLAISRLYGEALAEGPYTAPVYADDFDFAKMLAAFPKGHGAREALKYWTAKDKDAAWETVKALFGQKSEDATLSMGAMWGGVAASEGKERALAWLLARLDEIPQDMRADTVKNLMRQNEAQPEDYGALIKAFPRQDDRLNFASGTIAVWGDLNDRAATFAPFIRAEEHSAQQPPHRLRAFEDEFKRGEINLLACSTTMEMGVDIGSVEAVLNTNVPPSIANYRQRVGRA